MKKILKFLVIPIIIVLILIGTKVFAEEKGFSTEGHNIMYNGKVLSFKDFLDKLALGNNSQNRGDFFNLRRSDLRGINLNFNGGINYLFDYRRELCVDHYTGDSLNHDYNYQISDIIDIDYNGKNKCFTVTNAAGKELKASINDSLKDKIINLCSMIYINGTYSEEKSYRYDTHKGRSPLLELLTATWMQFTNDDNVDGFIDSRFISIDPIYLGISNFYGHSSWDIFENEYNGGSENAREEYNNLFNNCKNYKQISKKTVKNKGETIEAQENICGVEKPGNNYTTVGPFCLNFNQENGIDKILVKKDDNSDYVDVTNEVYVYIEKDGGERNFKKINQRSINANEVFYLAIKNDYLPSAGNEYKIKFTQKKLEYYKTRIVLMESMRQQQLGTFLEDSEKTSFVGEVEYKILRTSQGKRITLKKVGRQYDSNVGEALSGVELKVYGIVGNETGWVKENGDNIVELTNFDDATTWRTDNIGIVKIDHLNENGDYYIYETKTSEGYDLETQRERYPDGREDYPQGKAPDQNVLKNCVFLGTTAELEEWEQYSTIKYQYPSTRLTIEKVDSEDESRFIPGVKLKIYAKLDNGEEGWLTGNGGHLTHYGGSNTFVTDENGRINIDSITEGTYYIYEIEAGEGFDLDEQRNHYPNEEEPDELGFKVAGKSEYNNAVYLDKIQIKATEGEPIYQYIKQLKQYDDEPAKLTIRKKDYYDNSKVLNGVEFAIFMGDSGWLGYNGTEVTYEKDWKDAYKFKTGNAYCGENRVDGEFTLNNLRYGDYYVIEVSEGVNNKYELCEQIGYSYNSNYEFLSQDKWKMITNGNPVESVLIGSESYNAYDKKYTRVKKSNGKYYDFVRNVQDGQCDFIHLDWYKSRTWSYEKGSFDYGTNHATYIVMNTPVPDITIKKKDSETGESLNGAEFYIDTIISNEYYYIKPQVDEKGTIYATYKNGTGVQNRREDGAIVAQNGEVTIHSLRNATYNIYETKAPEGYSLDTQEGYIAVNNWVYCGTITVENGEVKYSESSNEHIKNFNFNNTTGNYELTIENIPNPYIDLNGYVWVGKSDTKLNERNSVYDDNANDYLYKDGMKVNLYKYDESFVNKELVATTTTYTENDVANDSNKQLGHYEFLQKITIDDLPYCEVEFEYDNTKYICVNPFEGNDTYRNSKAQEYKMDADELQDDLLSGNGIAITSPREDTTESHKLLYYYNSSNKTVENINLGLEEKFEPSFSIKERIDYVKVELNGYSYKYRYGDNAIESDFVPTTTIQTAAGKRFTAKIYPTDIAYNSQYSGALNVYVVYKIDIQNITEDKSEKESDDNYVEKKLYLNSLVSNFDGYRYELCTDTKDNSDFANWNTPNIVTENNVKIGTTTYKLDNGVYKNGIAKGETISSYIQFKVTDQALNDLIHQTINEELLDKAPTTAKANGYHEYLRTDNLWNHTNSSSKFDGCKGNYEATNSEGKKYYTHKSKSELRSSYDWYFGIKHGHARNISGTVFEDIRTKTGENEETIGNGILDSSEKNRVKGVKVELLDENKNLTKLYQIDDQGKILVKDAKTEDEGTNDDGIYEFEGVVPGKYYIKFTYGDGSQKIIDANNKETTVKSNDYKSTIINTKNAGNIIKDAYEAGNNEEGYWYKNLTGNTKYSTAVDDLSTISDIDTATYDRETEKEKYFKGSSEKTNLDNRPVQAYTPKVSVSYENDTEEETLVIEKTGPVLKNTYDKFNFGIIKAPSTVITPQKEIKNVTITNQVGTNIISASPKDKSVSEIKEVPDESGLSKSAFLETDLNTIYGAELDVTYDLSLENKSEIDYIEPQGSAYKGYYYKYGIKTSGATLKTVTVEELVDKLGTNYNINVIPDEGLEVAQVLKTSNTNKTPENVKIEKDDNGNLKMTKWSELERNEKTTITYNAKTLLSSEMINQNSAFTNDAEVTRIKLKELTKLTSESKWHERVETQLTITPPTGENRSYEAFILPGVLLVVMGVGIVLIKKYVM